MAAARMRSFTNALALTVLPKNKALNAVVKLKAIFDCMFVACTPFT
jgi:hypothetical protein